MAWQDRYRPGSFRGVPFVTVDHRHEFGRRGEAHEYPERDLPWFEDLGRRGREWSIEAFVIGADYMTGRDALLAALEQAGPGTLVHPFLGTIQAQPVSCSLTESTREGGMARFDLKFVEPGIALAAEQDVDTQGAVDDAADATDAAAAARFAGDFDVSGSAPFVQVAAIDLVSGFVETIGEAGLLLGGSGPVLRAFQIGLSTLGGASTLVAAPDNLAAVAIGLVSALGQLGSRPLFQVRAQRQLIAAAAALPAVATPTPARARQALNQQAFADLVICAAAGAAVRSAAQASFASYDEAVALRDALGGDLDQQASAAHERGDADLAADLDTLRRAMVDDVTARGGSLARLYGYTPPAVLPALVIAWQLGRDPASVIEQAAAIVARNRVRHPGFVPAAPLQVATGAKDG